MGIVGAPSLLALKVNRNGLPEVVLLDDSILHCNVIRGGEGQCFHLSQSPIDLCSRLGSEAVYGMLWGVGCHMGWRDKGGKLICSRRGWIFC